MIIADMDGTILERWSPGDYTPRPGPISYADAILTNQGGVALHWAGFKGFYGLDIAMMRVRVAMEISNARVALLSVYSDKQNKTWRGRLLHYIGKKIPPVPMGNGVFLSLDPHHHKPAPGGLWWLIDRFDVSSFEHVCYIGDSRDDLRAAQAAEVKFMRV